jgi:hypothetical protein
MTGACPPAPLAAEVALLDLLGRARRALARADEAELGRLLPLLARLRAAPEASPAGTPAPTRRAVLALLDEAGQLAGQIRQERARLAAELRAAGVHRRAGVAYRRASRL